VKQRESANEVDIAKNTFLCETKRKCKRSRYSKKHFFQTNLLSKAYV
jgi:hypothetical protein